MVEGGGMLTGRWIGGGAALALVGGLGTLAGTDAAGQVDRFYISPPVHAERARPMPESSPDDWNQPPASSTTWASATQGQSVAIVGNGRGDGSDLIEIDRAVEQAGAVRVHRSRPTPVERAVVDSPLEDQAPADVPTA